MQLNWKDLCALKKRVRHRDLDALCDLADYYAEQKHNKYKQYKLYEKAGKRGSPRACYWLFLSRDTSIGKKDAWLEKAAMLGHPDAECQLGINLYLKYNRSGADTQRALMLFQKGAQLGHANSQYYLGRFYSGGVGVEKDQAVAYDLFVKAANQGNAAAMEQLGSYYRWHSEGERAQAKAVAMEWYRKAAAAGSASAMFEIGNMYYYGEVAQSHSRAKAWYEEAAKKGCKEAQNALDKMGGGLPADIEAAYMANLTRKIGNIRAGRAADDDGISPGPVTWNGSAANAGAPVSSGEIY